MQDNKTSSKMARGLLKKIGDTQSFGAASQGGEESPDRGIARSGTLSSRLSKGQSFANTMPGGLGLSSYVKTVELD
jgi:hypothetical protein